MTPIDVRVKFKMATGNSPLWSNNPYLIGKKRSIYGIWMEEELGDPLKLRDEYFTKEKDLPIIRNRCNEEWLSKGYMDWLEEKLMKEK